MGTKDMDFIQLNQLIGRKTGGISVYPFTSSIRGKDEPCSHMIVRGKAMAGRVEDLFDLVYRYNFRSKCIYIAVMLRRMMEAVLNPEAIDDKDYVGNKRLELSGYMISQQVQFTDQQRFKQFVSQSKARMENRLRGSGHGIAASRMDAKLNVAGWISEQMGGIR